MRLGECCQLRTDDVTEIEGIPVILINDTAEADGDEADRKRVKTEAGKRFVPVHPELQRIGFLKFVRSMRARREKRLFPEIRKENSETASFTSDYEVEAASENLRSLR